MLWLIIGCGLLALVGITGMLIAFHESRRPDIMIIDDHIDRERVRKFLNLTEKEKARCVGENAHDG